MEVLKLIAFFECIATLHTGIFSFKTGDTWEVAVSGVDDYPQLYLLQNFESDGTDKRISWTVKFRVHAIQKRDESDENTILNDTFQIVSEVLEYIRQSDEYNIAQDWQAFSFTEADDDYLAGWAVTIKLTAVNPIDRCTIDGAFISSCDYSTSLVNISVIGNIEYLTINGMQNFLNSPYLVQSPTIGTSEYNRLITDLNALGYDTTGSQVQAIGQVVTNMQFAINATGDIFTDIKGRLGGVLFVQTNCVI